MISNVLNQKRLPPRLSNMLNRQSIIIAGTVITLLFTYLFSSWLGFFSTGLPPDTITTTHGFIDSNGISQPNSQISYGLIKDKVAIITDTQYTPRLIPIILHYHAVLGPSWPIIFYTSESLVTDHLSPTSANVSASWRTAVSDGRIQVRILPPNKFNMVTRQGVNDYMAHPWMWEQLAPASHVLVFQTDSILCANAAQRVEDFFPYDFVGAVMTFNSQRKEYNGGLSLRNRTFLLDIIHSRSQEKGGKTTFKTFGKDESLTCGEDCWFSKNMFHQGGNMPDQEVAFGFALQYDWHFSKGRGPGRPLGYHKIHKNVPKMVPKIAEWCPEIELTKAGNLKG